VIDLGWGMHVRRWDVGFEGMKWEGLGSRME
jgi:hypothetical protein